MGILSLKLKVSWGTASSKVASMNIWSDGLATIAPKICGYLNLNYVMHRMLYMNAWMPHEHVAPSVRSLALFWHGGVLAAAASPLANANLEAAGSCPLGKLHW